MGWRGFFLRKGTREQRTGSSPEARRINTSSWKSATARPTRGDQGSSEQQQATRKPAGGDQGAESRPLCPASGSPAAPSSQTRQAGAETRIRIEVRAGGRVRPQLELNQDDEAVHEPCRRAGWTTLAMQCKN